MDDIERAELIAALHQAATFAEALLDLNTRLLDALTTGENRPDAEELEYLRAGLSRWRAQVATLRQRIHGLTVEPSQRDAVTLAERALIPARARFTRRE